MRYLKKPTAPEYANLSYGIADAILKGCDLQTLSVLRGKINAAVTARTKFQSPKVGKGEYRNFKIAELALAEPLVFYDALATPGFFAGEKLDHAKMLASWCEHMLPTSPGMEFRLALSPRGLLRKISEEPAKSPIDGERVVRMPHLDLRIVQQLHARGDQAGAAIFMRQVRMTLAGPFFGGDEDSLGCEEFKTFFGYHEQRFSMTCQKKHALPELQEGKNKP